MSDSPQTPDGQGEEVVFFIPWSEKRQEFSSPPTNEEMVGQNWDMYENLMFFYLMWLGTY
jgi:hypothetical protein